MTRLVRLRRLGASAAVPLLLLSAFWGCATGATDTGSPDEPDPNAPEVDASRQPVPAKGDSGGKETGSSDADPDEPEAGTDAGKDAGKDAGDAGSDAGKDSGTDAGKDSGPDASDSGTDASDSGTDASDDAGDSGTAPPKPAPGEILVTEVMFDPSGAEPANEWFEVLNTTASPRSLSDLTIVDGASRAHKIGAGITIAPGAYVLLVRSQAAASAAQVPAAAIVYEYGTGLDDLQGIQLSNGASGGVFLKDGPVTVAQSDYGTWFTSSGNQSIQLKTLTAAGAAQKAGWCVSTVAWAAGADKGTPGAANNCP